MVHTKFYVASCMLQCTAGAWPHFGARPERVPHSSFCTFVPPAMPTLYTFCTCFSTCHAPVICCVSRVARRSAVWCRGRIMHAARRALHAQPMGLPAVQQCAVNQVSVGPSGVEWRGGRAAVRQKQSGSARAAAANQRRTDWHYSTRRTIVLTRVVYSGTDGDLQRPAKCMDVVGVGAVVEPYEFVPAMVYLSVVCSRCLSFVVCATGGHARPDD